MFVYIFRSSRQYKRQYCLMLSIRHEIPQAQTGWHRLLLWRGYWHRYRHVTDTRISQFTPYGLRTTKTKDLRLMYWPSCNPWLDARILRFPAFCHLTNGNTWTANRAQRNCRKYWLLLHIIALDCQILNEELIKSFEYYDTAGSARFMVREWVTWSI